MDYMVVVYSNIIKLKQFVPMDDLLLLEKNNEIQYEI